MTWYIVVGYIDTINLIVVGYGGEKEGEKVNSGGDSDLVTHFPYFVLCFYEWNESESESSEKLL